METMHRKRNKYEIIFSFGFDLGRLGQNQLWKKRFISNFWAAGQNPTVFYCDHSNETFLEVLFADFTGFLCFYRTIFGFCRELRCRKGKQWIFSIHCWLCLCLWSGQISVKKSINRGYCMAAQRYEISLSRVLKNISRVSAANEWNIFSTLEKKFRISKRPCNVLFII